ncbi:unnamed protein product [Ectocarpus sp. CCAP 1310/34]|nr:unnamed protein product [Ectocarpus sp. CCAP 1310/34]
MKLTSLLTLAGLGAGSAFVAPATAFHGAGVAAITAPRGSSSASCQMMARVPFIAGNWKMNPLDVDSAKDLAKSVSEATTSVEVEVAVIPPHPFLVPVKDQVDGVDGNKVAVGSQDLYTEDAGAFTGASSTGMLASVGCEYILCGHSERRSVFGDSDEMVNKKVHKVLDQGLKAILCIGESKEEYEAGLNKEICAVHIGKGLMGVTAEQMENIVIAYEPVWAIGTGLTATPADAQGIHKYVRSLLAAKYGDSVADSVRIQYGGSVTPETVDELMACPDIDGALVGGASLVAEKFARIVGFKSPVSA